MKKVTRFACEICHDLFVTPENALECERTCKEEKMAREKAQSEESSRIRGLKEKGIDEWYEYNGAKQGPFIDPHNFGPHNFGIEDGTTDCGYGCGCWMGPSRSGGPYNPMGACPKNPKKKT